MHKTQIAGCVLGGMLVVSGCAGSAGPPETPAPRPLARDIPAAAASANPGKAQPLPAAAPSDTLTLAEALTLALLRNPDLSAASWEVRVREAEAIQAGLAPNPELGLELENFGGSGGFRGTRGLETTLSLTQVLELGGKRGNRERLARLEGNLSRWDYEAERLEVCTRTTLAFVSVLAAQERVGIAAGLVTVAERFEETVSRRVSAGAVSPVEETRARVSRSTTVLELRAAERRLRAERRKLSALWGSAEPGFRRVRGNLDRTGAPVPLDRLVPLLEQNPDIARRITEMERGAAAADLAASEARPDLTLTGGVRRLGETSDNTFLLGIGIPLPLADRNQGSRRAAEFDLHRTRERERAARVQATTSLAVIHEAWSSAHEEILALDGEILPQAELALGTAQDAYRRGLFRLTDVLDTQRTLFELQMRRVDALERYHHARTDIEGLIGESVEDERRKP